MRLSQRDIRERERVNSLYIQQSIMRGEKRKGGSIQHSFLLYKNSKKQSIIDTLRRFFETVNCFKIV